MQIVVLILLISCLAFIIYNLLWVYELALKTTATKVAAIKKFFSL